MIAINIAKIEMQTSAVRSASKIWTAPQIRRITTEARVDSWLLRLEADHRNNQAWVSPDEDSANASASRCEIILSSANEFHSF